jgi:uncharacterized membrane protein
VKPLLAAPLSALALAALSPAVHAQAPRAPAPGAPVAVPGLSPAGNAVLQRLSRQADPAAPAIQRDQIAFAQRMNALINAPAIDLDKFAAALRDGQALQGRVRALSDARLMTILRALPPADRKTFLRLVAASGQQRPPAR